MRSKKYGDIENRIYCAMPDQRDERARPAFIPNSVVQEKALKADGGDLPKRRLEKDIEAENGGPGVYSMDMRKNYLLDDDDWKYDVMPEIIDGKNILDFIDPDIDQRLAELEEEEERRLEEELMGAGEAPFELTDQNKETLKMVQYSVAMSRMENAEKKARGRGKLGRVGDAVSKHQELIHKDRSQDGRGRKRKRDDEDDGDYERDGTPQRSLSATARSTSTLRSSAKSRFLSNSPASRDRGVSVSKLGGLKSGVQKMRAMGMARKKARPMARYVKSIQPSYLSTTHHPQRLAYGRVRPSQLRHEAQVALHREGQDQRKASFPLSLLFCTFFAFPSFFYIFYFILGCV